MDIQLCGLGVHEGENNENFINLFELELYLKIS